MAKKVGFDDNETSAGRQLLARFGIFVWHCFLDIFKRAFKLRGRTSREVFWVQFGLLVLIMNILWMRNPSLFPFSFFSLLWASLGVLYLMVTIIIRRAHDIGESLWGLIPFGLGFLVNVVKLFLFPGKPGPNYYGPAMKFTKREDKIDPKRIG